MHTVTNTRNHVHVSEEELTKKLNVVWDTWYTKDDNKHKKLLGSDKRFIRFQNVAHY